MNQMVSIITPVYNAEKYLKSTLNSVIEQTYENWEMIIVNDCSTDRSLEIINSFLEIDSRFRLINLKKNQGVAHARNTAINEAKGKFIAFLDGDDLWTSVKLEKQISQMEKNNWLFTFSNYNIIDENGEQSEKVIKAPSKLDYKKLLNGNSIGCLTVVINREKIPNIKMPESKHEDYITWLSILKTGIIAYGIDESLALYRKSNNSLSSNKINAAKWTWDIYRKHQKLNFFRASKSFVMYSLKAIMKHS